MFRKFGLISLKRGSNTRCNGAVRNNHSFDGSHRYQSSFTFLNNQSLLQKDQVKQSKRKKESSNGSYTLSQAAVKGVGFISVRKGYAKA